MLKQKELLRSSTGDVVCFSMANIQKLAGKLKVDEEVLIQRLHGVVCPSSEIGESAIDEMSAVGPAGDVYPVFVIGLRGKVKRFLTEGEPDMDEFLQSHPRFGEIGTGATFNPLILEQLEEEYRSRYGQ